MSTDILTSITEALSHLVANGAPLPEILREINQFAIVLVPAETCTTWIREGQHIIVCKDTAYPLSRTRSVSGVAIPIREGEGVGLTAYMAYQFAHEPEHYPFFNLSHDEIMKHRAYGGGALVNPYFPRSTTSLSILCAPIYDKPTSDFLGMIKVENKTHSGGGKSGEKFSDDASCLLVRYAGIVGARVFSCDDLNVKRARKFI